MGMLTGMGLDAQKLSQEPNSHGMTCCFSQNSLISFLIRIRTTQLSRRSTPVSSPDAESACGGTHASLLPTAPQGSLEEYPGIATKCLA